MAERGNEAATLLRTADAAADEEEREDEDAGGSAHAEDDERAATDDELTFAAMTAVDELEEDTEPGTTVDARRTYWSAAMRAYWLSGNSAVWIGAFQPNASAEMLSAKNTASSPPMTGTRML